MVRFLLALLSVAVATQPATAEMIAGGGGEFLLVDPPTGWVTAHVSREAAMSFTQFVPEGESFEVWSEAIQAQVFHNRTSLTPSDFLANIFLLYEDGCDDADADPIETREVAGYAVAGRTFFCGSDKVSGEGEIAVFKVIAGKNGLYAVNRAWRGPAFDTANPPLDPEMMDQWATYFGTVRICDDGNREARCTLADTP